MGKTKIIIKDTKNNQAIVELIAGNGETVMTSETLRTTQAVKKNVAAVQKIAKTAVIIDQRKATLPKKTTK